MIRTPLFTALAAAAMVSAAPAWAQFTESAEIKAQGVAGKEMCSRLLDTDPRKIARDCVPDVPAAPALDANASASVGANSLDPSGTFPVTPSPEINPGADPGGGVRGADLNTGANVNRDPPPANITGTARPDQQLGPPALPQPAR